MQLLAVIALLLSLGAPARADDSAETSPHTWPVAFQETYLLLPHEGQQLELEPDGISVRRFHLRVDSPTEIEVKVTRAYDNSILWMERRASDIDALIPWGRDERGTVSIFNPMRFPVRILVVIATDPAEERLAVHSFYVNRFLEALEEGAHEEDLRLLDRALAQDAQDTVAAKLLARVTGLEGSPLEIAEDRFVEQARERIDTLRRDGKTEEIDEFLAQERDFETDRGRRHWFLLVGRERMRREQAVRALQAFYAALDAAPDVAARFEVYPELVAANVATGNTEQAEAIVERALEEAPDDDTRQRVEEWRSW